MRQEQFKNSGILVLSNLAVNLSNFLKQVIMAYFLGVSSFIDLLLLAQIVPAIFQAMIGGGAGEILVIKREKPGSREGSFEMIFIIFCLIPVIFLCIGYFLSLGMLTPFFEIKTEDEIIFRKLTFIFLLNAIPGTFTSVLRPHLYSKGLYSFYAKATIFSQVAGITFILFTLKDLGIFSFAWGTLIGNIINSIWFSFKAGLAFGDLFRYSIWRQEFSQLIKLMKRVFSLGLQTFLNYFGTFWERSLSVKYLSGGYLSSLNYSKTLSELPNAVLMSSILTTSYIEQVKLFKKDFVLFKEFTGKTFSEILNFGFIFQLLMLVFAPLIIIIIFRRGNFNNLAVESTLTIFNILTVSFLPKLLFGYFSRSMYILGEYRKLLLASFIKVSVQIIIMFFFISSFKETIPFAILSGNLVVTMILFYILHRKIGLAKWDWFLLRIIIITIVSLLMYKFHVATLHYYILRSNFQIFLVYFPLILLISAVIIIYLIRTRRWSLIIKKFKAK